MLLHVNCEIGFILPEPTAIVLMLHLHPSLSFRTRRFERLETVPYVPVMKYFDIYGNQCARVHVPAGHVVFRNDAIVEDNGLTDPQASNARQHSVQDLPDDALLFLLASRYCEVDSELKEIAWNTFGHLPAGWPLVQAVCDFVHRHVRFDYMQARATRTALDVYRERIGVCRDYMHLAITFCRCLNIPARYCTGYLGDIGVPRAASPMDFSAWFEVYLGGNWYAFDARNNIPRIGRTLMARGRDAADVALTTTFGVNKLESFKVVTEEIFSMSMA
ncbi:transglutaminase-like domain-containing protein [Zavarzinella formosa]|uniref:transglutaminase-like domain-containing protein n=1 Tax=Zavarzinella formosa TaxID=360055 RepID=UPI0003084048|nr:transglutaminase family protein [Zavarzinella formosa]